MFLKQEGFIKNYKVISDNLQGVLRVYLKYIDEKDSVINEIKRVSKPGGRVYVKSEDIPVSEKWSWNCNSFHIKGYHY